MKKFLKRLRSYAFFIIFRSRIFTREKAKEVVGLAKNGDRILEIGSGGLNENGEYYFSIEPYFKGKQINFIMSDINPNFGHKVIDVSELNEDQQYNHIVCFHVLDEVYDWQRAFLNLYRALKIGGYLHIVLPVFVPLPMGGKIVSYYRFTSMLLEEFCIRNDMLIDKLEIQGFKMYPFTYYLRIKKK